MENTVENYSEKYGKTAEVGVWSHAAYDGPRGSKDTEKFPLYGQGATKQMSPEGWGSINYNWKENNSKNGFYGCNTGNDTKYDVWVGSFSRMISSLKNYKNVEVGGQSSSAVPSLYPHIRAETLTRRLFGQTYYV